MTFQKKVFINLLGCAMSLPTAFSGITSSTNTSGQLKTAWDGVSAKRKCPGWTDALRLFVIVYRTLRFVNMIFTNEAVPVVTCRSTP